MREAWWWAWSNCGLIPHCQFWWKGQERDFSVRILNTMGLNLMSFSYVIPRWLVRTNSAFVLFKAQWFMRWKDITIYDPFSFCATKSLMMYFTSLIFEIFSTVILAGKTWVIKFCVWLWRSWPVLIWWSVVIWWSVNTSRSSWSIGRHHLKKTFIKLVQQLGVVRDTLSLLKTRPMAQLCQAPSIK